MADVHYKGKPPEQRIRDRYANSGAALNPNTTVQTGQGPNRLFTNIHHGSTEHGTNPSPAMPKGKDLIGYYGDDVKGRR
jgi:hypothetical protein